MPWIEHFVDVAVEIGLLLHAGTTNQALANDDWSKMKKKKNSIFDHKFCRLRTIEAKNFEKVIKN